jgi:hypothetical protein
MSRKKDRERVIALKRLNPDYAGFRGSDRERDQSRSAPMASLECSVCGRKRNVPAGLAQEQGNDFVCTSCIDNQGIKVIPESS